MHVMRLRRTCAYTGPEMNGFTAHERIHFLLSKYKTIEMCAKRAQTLKLLLDAWKLCARKHMCAVCTRYGQTIYLHAYRYKEFETSTKRDRGDWCRGEPFFPRCGNFPCGKSYSKRPLFTFNALKINNNGMKERTNNISQITQRRNDELAAGCWHSTILGRTINIFSVNGSYYSRSIQKMFRDEYNLIVACASVTWRWWRAYNNLPSIKSSF